MLEMLDKRAAPRVDLDTITNIAANSSLARMSWRGDRGKAPIGYTKGMAVMFAVVLQKLAQRNPLALEMAKAATGDSHRDALSHYASEFDALGMRNDVSGIDTLRHLFVLMIGLGMRESSGRYCEGRDQSASNTSAETAEAGLFQMSWDSRRGCPQIAQLLDEYQASGAPGYRDIFAEGVTPRSRELENFGSGMGETFQQMSKECPAFAVEAAAVGLRNIGGVKGHWGPIRTKAAELRLEADDMLQQVQNAVAGAATGQVPLPQEPAHGTLWVQQSLNKLGADPRLDEDGEIGPFTMAAVSQFQRENGLGVTGFADGATLAAIDRKLRFGGGGIPSGPTEITAWLERLVRLIERLKTPTTPVPAPGSQQPEQLRKALELLAILVPGAGGKSAPLGQVNGALGETLGKLLNGKKTAIGVIGTALTAILSNVPAGTGLGDVLTMLTPTALTPAAPFTLPIFLALSAWGVLGKFEKWNQGTAPPPRIPE
jgi:peptidoglycan hydrolase-like protein with peptidoglycan-binding domain